ncbi:MAG: hypothetical protein KDJ45_08280 [Hyphomicrobiaceae bacterium]|nr:hypothetical protein [Hyphomicrobiaceae bacterium]MCC0010641.1 hypothetical protein [Hyphomicrobiaceae bacterium]
MSCTPPDIGEQHRNARRFTQIAFGLAALAAIAVAAIIGHTVVGTVLTDEARQVVTWSLVGLAALDAALLCSWPAITRWIEQWFCPPASH